ncbi:MAG TPA: hypothetical protein VHS55_07890 [Solirubrobacteraceae bacterium]|jgi:hypothetical protein|nr:hypothetical protein [Solirubrobacteraceae bacterium]
MDREVARTLGELELKLRELERELTSIGRRATEPPPRAPLPPQHPAAPPQHTSPPAPPAAGRLVDEALERQPERRYSMEAQETAFGEIPATKDQRDTIDLAELVRFKQTMQETLQGLIGEYSRLLALRPPSGD